MSKSVTNKQQMAKLVELMEYNPDLAKGLCPKSHSKERWETFVKTLNSLGPPYKSYHKWVKVWTDLKSKTKKKISKNRQLSANTDCNGIYTYLSPLDLAVDQIMDFSNSIDPLEDDISDSTEQNGDVSCSLVNTKEEDESANECSAYEFEDTTVQSRRTSLISDVKNEIEIIEELSVSDFVETTPLPTSVNRRRTPLPSNELQEVDTTNEVSASDLDENRLSPLPPSPRAKRRKTSSAQSSRAVLLAEHSKAERKFHKDICRQLECLKNSIDVMRYQQKEHFQIMQDIQKEKLNLIRENNENNERYRAEKLKLLKTMHM